MAETFAVNPGQVANVLGLGGPVLDRTQTGGAGQGGVSLDAVRINPHDAKNMEALLKLGGDLLAPHIKAAQQQQYMEGMRRAAEGEALNDIVDDQPWYTQIFGPSSASMGARAYSAQAAISKFGADMERQMPRFAKDGPMALQRAAQESMQSMLTGDAIADAAIMQAYSEQIGPLMKRQAKEQYIYQQKQANLAQVTSWDAAFDAYQQRAQAAANPEGGVSLDDIRAEGDKVLSMLYPFGDQSDESYQSNVVAALQGAAAKGNFHIINLLSQEGVMNALPPDDQARLLQTFRAAGQRAVGEALPNFAVDVAMLVNDTAQDPRGIAARAQALNAKVAAYTGVSTQFAQAIPNASIDNIVGNVLRAQASAAAAGPTRQEQLVMASSLLGQPGAVAQAVTIGMIPDNVAEEAALRTWTTTTNPVQRAQILNTRGSGTYNTIKQDLQTNYRANPQELSDGFRNVAATYQGMTEDARGEYFSSDQQKVLDRYNAGLASNMTPEQAWVNAKVFTPLVNSVIPENEVKDYRKSLRKLVEDKNESWYGRNTVTDSSLRVLEAFTNKNYMSNRGLQDIDTSANRALAGVLASGQVEVVGTHAIINSRPGTPSILGYMQKGTNNKGAKETAEALDFVLRAKARDAGMDIDKGNYTITRAADVGGKFRFVVDLGGEVNNFLTITEDELRAHKAVPLESDARRLGRMQPPSMERMRIIGQ